MDSESSAKLEKIRESIDDLDAKLVSLLNERARLVLEVKSAKKEDNIRTYSAVREKQILDRVISLSAGGKFPKSALEKIFLSVISATRSLIGETKVGYLGEEGSRANVSAFSHFGGETLVASVSKLDDLLHKIQNNELHYGVLVVEGAFSDPYFTAFSSLAHSNVKIVGEGFIDSQLFLASKKEGLSEIKEIVADAASFAFCSSWINSEMREVERVLVSSPAQAAKYVANHPESGCIVPQLILDNEQLTAIASSIQDGEDRAPRYLVFGTEAPPASGKDKTSLMVTLANKSGALSEVLKVLASCNLSLTKIESRSGSSTDGDVIFFLDFLGHVEGDKEKEALKMLSGFCSFVSVLGSYPTRG